MKLYFVRHGQTDWNLADRVLGGTTDMPLNETGLSQAHAAGEKVKGETFDIIFSSPMARSLKTAEIINTYLKTSAEIITDERLREMRYGSYEGCSRNDPKYLWHKHQYFTRYPDGGESYADMVSRVYGFLNELKTKKYDKVLIAAHGCVGRVFRTYFENMENEAFSEYLMENASYLEYEL